MRGLLEKRADIAIAACSRGSHPTIGLWPVDLAERLEHDLMETNVRSMLHWISAFRVTEVEFPSELLMNVNTPAELEACRKAAA
jgi:molybdopterin-guanine dinucleotide biosynthesis protein A